MRIKTAILLVVLSVCFISLAIADEKETVVLTGKCNMVGSANFPILQFSVDKKENYSVSGPYFEELKNLEGIIIKVVANKTDGKQGLSGLEVIEYEILDVGKGVKPFVGVLKVFNNKLSIMIKDTPIIYELTGNTAVLEKLGNLYNAKVWIAGDETDGKLKIRKYGIIRRN